MNRTLEKSSWPVMVLAHNEERHIEGCLDSIFAADTAGRFEVYVMANGCTDATEQIVRQYAQKRPQVRLVSIALGDKCNAWNVFIHEIAPAHCAERDVVFFMDGDARALPGSFSAMANALAQDEYAHAASAPPASGHNVARDRGELLQKRGLVANLYALRGTFVRRLQAMAVRLPLNLEGDDGLLGAMIKWDLAPERQGFDHQRIVPCPTAGFEFEPLSPLRPADWLAYWRRAVRYGRRRYEFQLLRPLLMSTGLSALPSDITALYGNAGELRLRWQGLYTLPNLVALRRMRKVAALRSA